MPDRHLKLLIVDDSPEDRTVVRFMLEEAPGRTWQFIEEEKGARALLRLEQEEVDCILLDNRLPDMNGVRFLRDLTQRFGRLRFPVVVFTGEGRASLPEQVLEEGAQDCLSKDMIRVDSLVRAIDNSIRQVHLLREAEEHREELKAVSNRLKMLETALREIYVPVLVTDAEPAPAGPRIMFVNAAFSALTGYSEAEVMGKTPKMLSGPKTDREALAVMRHELLNGRSFSGKMIYYRKDGSEFTLNLTVSPLQDTNQRTTHFVASQGKGTSPNAFSRATRVIWGIGNTPEGPLCAPVVFRTGAA